MGGPAAAGDQRGRLASLNMRRNGEETILSGQMNKTFKTNLTAVTGKAPVNKFFMKGDTP